LPRRTPEIEDIGRFVEHHLRSDPSAHVICDLHALDSLDTILLARLVALNKRIRSTGGRLTLRGMRPVVREVFLRLALDRVFEIADDEPEPFGAGQ
jgi:anti-anti-sigma regulatory factor